MAFSGEFETHLSVAGNVGQLPDLQRWAERHGWRCLHIVLARGGSTSQPMITRRARGNLADQLLVASEHAEKLAMAGFPVMRIKVEAAPSNADVPQADGEARCADRYFEQHIKLLLASGADEAALAAVAMRHGAHLSRNALCVREDGHSERFVTQRCARVGRRGAQRRLDALLADLQPLGHAVLDVEQEYVVYDSNEALDAGWIEEAVASTL